jgi:hypothetical protein
MEETELQQRLTRLAERTAPPPRERLAEVVVARQRSQRRQTIGITSLVAVVAAVVVAVPSLLGGPSSTLVPETSAAVDEGPTVDVFAGPTRGSLAGDAAFVEGVRRLSWSSSAGSDVPVDTRRVVFAGEVAGVRLALVAGENTAEPEQRDPALRTDQGALSDVAIAWFAGSAGATPQQMQLASVPAGVDPTVPAALSDAATGALVVVTAPGDTVEVSPRPEIAADASVSRTWQPVDAPDGVAELALAPSAGPFDQALRYRVSRDGAELVTTMQWGHVAHGPVPSTVPLDWMRPAPVASPADTMLGGTVQQLLGLLGVTPASARVSVVWAGDVPAPVESGTARLHLLAATLPSGAVYLQTSLAIAFPDGASGGSESGSGIRPAGTPLYELTVAVRCDATDMSEGSDVVSSLVVVAPATAVSARAVDVDGEVLAEFPLAEGVAVVPFPERATDVETLAADGTVLERTRPLTHADLGD